MGKSVNTDLSKILSPKFKNKWVALSPKQDKVIAAAKSPKEVLAQAKKQGVKEPVVTYVVPDYGFFIP